MATPIVQPTPALVPKVKWAAIGGAVFTALAVALAAVLPDLANAMPGWLYSILTAVAAVATGWFKKDEV